MRGEGNHKIPGSFAPENMEKTGAERVKYSLACQHEDVISIKFISYAQKYPTVLCTFAVALRKESVDRKMMFPINVMSVSASLSARRAWIEKLIPLVKFVCFASLSARRAWIENRMALFPAPPTMVALRKESVDRKVLASLFCVGFSSSLSARRAWIENLLLAVGVMLGACRSPQGERG